MSKTPEAASSRVVVPQVLSILEAAQFARLHPNTISKLYRRGELAGSLVAGKTLITGESLAAYLTRHGIPSEVAA